MAEISALSLSFIERQPAAAAAAVSELDPSDAAAFLNAVPARYGGAIIARTASWSASLIIAEMQRSAASALLQQIFFQDAAAIFRLLPEDKRDVLLDAIPKGLREDLETSLSFPTETVGANMTPNVVALRATNTVEDALDEIRRTSQDSPQSVYIVTKDRKLIGAIEVTDLLRHSPSATLGEIASNAPEALSARASLRSAVAHVGWLDHLFLPVISRRKYLIGAISRKAMTTETRKVSADRHQSTVIGATVEAYFDAAAGLARLLADVPSAPRKGEPL